MESKGALKWLSRLEQPRTIESLISEVYGEAAFYGCLFEGEMADLLNFYELKRTFKEFKTEDISLSGLIKEVGKRGILEEKEMLILTDAKDARNELIHRLITKKPLVSKIDREMFLAEIDSLYYRIWCGHHLASFLKEHFASEIGITREVLDAEKERRMDEGAIEDEYLRCLLGDDPKEEA